MSKRLSPKIVVSEGCDFRIAKAVERFRKDLHKELGTKKVDPERGLIKKLIAPAWKIYHRHLPARVQKCWEGFFFTAENFSKTETHLLRGVKASRSLSDWSSHHQNEASYEATIDTLRNVLWLCDWVEKRRHRGREIRSDHIDRHRRLWTDYCAWANSSGKHCGRLTEYVSYTLGGEIQEDTAVLRCLDTRHCSKHIGHEVHENALRLANEDIRIPGGVDHEIERFSGRGLCRVCGRYTESDAFLDRIAMNSDRDVRQARAWASRKPEVSKAYCNAHKPPRNVPRRSERESNSAYRKMRRHQQEFSECHARMESQSHKNQTLKVIHEKLAVDWFENQIVRKLDIVLTSRTNPLEHAIPRAADLISRQCRLEGITSDECEEALRRFGTDLLTTSSVEESLEKLPGSAGVLLRKLKRTNDSQRGFSSVAILAMYFAGASVELIKQRLCASSMAITKAIRDVIPRVTPSVDAVNLGKAVHDLIEAKISVRRMEVIYHVAHGKSRAEISEILGITPQAVSKIWKSIPVRYQLPAEHIEEAWPIQFNPALQCTETPLLNEGKIRLSLREKKSSLKSKSIE